MTHKSTVLHGWQGAKLPSSLGLIFLALVFWFLPTPVGLSDQAYHLLIIFLTTIAAVILKPLPMGAIAIISVTLCILTKTLEMKEAFSSFSKDVVWLVVLAFFLALGFKLTGLGKRIAYFFISKIGNSTLGLSYGLVLTELFLAPFVPSNTARGAGIIFPIVTALAKEEGSDPEKGTQKKVGAFLLTVCFQANVITSAMFLTALVGNPMIAGFAQNAGVELSWVTWALAAVVPGLVALVVVPYVIFKIYPPELKVAPGAQDNAKQKLRELGPLSMNEKIMVISFGTILVLWVLGKYFGINPTLAALIGFSILLFTGVLHWTECIQEKSAWETFMWFAPLLMMATYLTDLGVMKWFAGHMETLVGGLTWPVTLLVIALVYFYINYIFASITSRITALYGVFLAVLIGAGTPPMVAAMTLAVLSSLSGGLTHFSTGTAPVFFGAHYVSVRSWWRNGFIISLVNLLIWGVVGGLWWKVIGYW